MSVLSQVLIILFGTLICYGSYRFIKTKQLFGELETLKKEYDATSAQWEKVSREIYNRNNELIDLNKEIEIAREKARSAKMVVEQELEIETIKRRDNYEQRLQEELKKLKETSDLAAYQKELESLQLEIKEAKETLNTLQNQQQQELEKENFIETHSIKLDNNDTADITLIKEFANKLTRRTALIKLIWTEFYQKPLQWLCKSLGADKVSGIYKITEQDTGRMYIGQAVDIGTRWKEHVKAGLGIDGPPSSKFYRSMNKLGPEHFTFEILEQCERKLLNEREAYWINFYNATSYGFNTKVGSE